MPTPDKRARKKQHRDEVLAQRMVEYRRRRITRIVAGLVVLALVVVAVMTSRKDEPDKDADPKKSPSAEAGAVACGGPQPGEVTRKALQYDSPPKDQLEDGVDYKAVIETSCGTIEMDLLEDSAPINVNNFVFLAREGFYDNTTWHRIERSFVIQGGDPDGQNGTPPDGPGYSIADELPEKANAYVYGTFAMANSGAPDSGGSQFFIIVHEPVDEPAGLQPNYSVIGKVDEASYPTLDAIATLEVMGGDDPVESVKPVATTYVYSITIVEA